MIELSREFAATNGYDHADLHHAAHATHAAHASHAAHAAHATHAAAAVVVVMVVLLALLGDVGDDRFGGQQQAGDAGAVLQGGARRP